MRATVICVVAICSLILFAGCTDATDTTNTTGATEPTETTVSTETATSEEVARDRTVKLTGNYSYKIPGDFVKTEGTFEANALKAKCFTDSEETIQIKSWIIDGDFLFPDDVEALEGDDDTEIGYGDLYNTAIAKITDSTTDENGASVYRTRYVWPDGPEHTCFIEITSQDEDYSDLVKQIRGSIRNANADADCGPYGFIEDGTPTEEEIDKALLEDAQDAYEEYMWDQMEPEDEYPYHY